MTGTTMTTKDNGVDVAPATGPPGPWQSRYFQVLLLFLGFTFAYSMRICMSVAIVAMTYATVGNPEFEVYDWGSIEKGKILSSFFWGYIITQIPAGYIANIWNAKSLFAIGVCICSILSLLTPFAAHYGGWQLVCACRVGMGLCQGCVLPCIHTLLSKWVPPAERARLGSIAYSGSASGTVIANLISGVLSESKGGWPSVFYFFGGISLVWSIAFFIFGAHSPSTSSRIGEAEKRYIESSIGESQGDKTKPKSSETPWKAILTSGPVWALIIAHCTQNWGFWVLVSEISLYMNAILHFDLTKNGFMAALPYLTMLVLAFPMSWVSDFALKKGVRRVVLRKVCNSIAHWGPALALIGLCFTRNEGRTLPVVILVLAVGANVGALCGFQINHIDLSPNYAGILVSITNCIASIVAILAPLIVSIIVTDEMTDFSQWQTVFYISAIIYFIGNLIFIIFGSAEKQWWDDPKAVRIKNQGQVFSTPTVNTIA